MPDNELEKKFALVQSYFKHRGGRAWHISDEEKPGYFVSVYMSGYRKPDIDEAVSITGLAGVIEASEPQGHANVSRLHVGHAITEEQLKTFINEMERITGIREDIYGDRQKAVGRPLPVERSDPRNR